uniref:Dynein axonemal intermediate chain 7 n=1 Tax=Scophthalmus maximus TaxID=52904 RepID=A0A8D3B229_SCOMX
EEQERLERERKQKELERLELKYSESREVDLNKLRHLLEKNHTAVTKWRADAAEKAKWDRYMRCDGKPDPAVQQDIYTYISLWRDDPEVNITPVLQQCDFALQLVEELESLLREVTDPREGQKYQESLSNLQELIVFKQQLATEDILKRANDNIDTETGNMQSVVKDDNITLCLWANFKKNPRFKEFNFEEVGLGFELPKQLAVSDIVVRILHTHYDHLSLLARMAQLQTHTPSHRSDGSSRNRSGDLTSSSVQGTVVDVSEIVQVVDLMEYTPLGGVFYYDVFCLPPQARHVHGWEIRQELDTGLQVFPYPTESLDFDDNEPVTCPPVGVSVSLPDCVVFLETPQVARWDAAGKQWRMDGITDVSYEKEEAKVTFKMGSFQAFVLMQDTYANLPFQSWELRPLDKDSAVFTVNGALIDLSITIQGDRCMLQTEQEKGLSHLQGKWMSCPVLQRAMLSAGINIFVNEYTDKYVSSFGKDPLTEHAAYEQMALFASACAFSWSKWNAECGAGHLVIQGCEHHGSDTVPKDSWSLFLLGAQRYHKLEITEKSEAFSPDHDPGTDCHSTFIHMLQDNMSADGIARTRGSNYLFVDTVQNLLCASRPLMHS